MASAVITEWYRIVAEADLAALERLVADDAVFLSPAVHAPQAGKALVIKYLSAAHAILANPTFKYIGEWVAQRSAVLEFELAIEGVYINGVDLISWNEAGQIESFKVMIRPIKGLNTVIGMMGQLLMRG
jgi:hypothetical protein